MNNSIIEARKQLSLAHIIPSQEMFNAERRLFDLQVKYTIADMNGDLRRAWKRLSKELEKEKEEKGIDEIYRPHTW